MSNYYPYKQPHTAYLQFCGKWLFKDKADSRIRTDNLSLKAIALPLSYAGICAPYKLPQMFSVGCLLYSPLKLLAHYPLPTDYRNHGVVLSPRIKFSAVALARICKPPFGRTPPVTVIPPQRIWVEFHFEHSGMMLDKHRRAVTLRP